MFDSKRGSQEYIMFDSKKTSRTGQPSPPLNDNHPLMLDQLAVVFPDRFHP